MNNDNPSPTPQNPNSEADYQAAQADTSIESTLLST